ncbi:hypothetical protein [uncultured Arthrobacter sp.]|uniref:hypothetical protein n=1 Tax=uncultured Arthrobacter sp. TaxID=114050 RepID=UPI0025D03EC3|nr:hypothetical protein [uncultured Arthrobacter sp.]
MADDEPKSAETRENLIRSARHGSRYGAFVWLTIGLILWAEGGKPAFVIFLLVGGMAQWVLAMYLSTKLPSRKLEDPEDGF